MAEFIWKSEHADVNDVEKTLNKLEDAGWQIYKVSDPVPVSEGSSPRVMVVARKPASQQ